MKKFNKEKQKKKVLVLNNNALQRKKPPETKTKKSPLPGDYLVRLLFTIIELILKKFIN